MQNKYYIIAFTVLLVVMDRLTKFFALKHLSLEGSGVFKLYINEGIIFSLPSPAWLSLTIQIIIIIVLLASLTHIVKYKKYKQLFSITLILFGALSNLLDRVLYGGVIDFIDLTILPIFNISDVLIISGAILLVLPLQKPPKTALLKP